MAAQKTKNPKNVKFVFYYVPCSDMTSARKMGRALLAKRLVGCINILPKMESHYWWKGRISAGQEVVLILKTTRAYKKQLITELRKIHPYSVPCLAEMPVSDLNRDYAQWLLENLALSQKA